MSVNYIHLQAMPHDSSDDCTGSNWFGLFEAFNQKSACQFFSSDLCFAGIPHSFILCNGSSQFSSI